MKCEKNETAFQDLRKTGEWLSIFLLLYIGLPVILVGISTSILSFAMFARDQITPKTTRFLLQTIAVADVLFLLLYVPYAEVKLLGHVLERQHAPANITGKVLLDIYNIKGYLVTTLYSIQTVELFRNWVTVLIGIERYLVICWPLRSVRLITKLRVVIITIGIAFASCLIRSPLLVRHLIRKAHSKSTDLDQLTQSIHEILDTIFLFVLPIIILLACCCRILRTMKSSAEKMKQNTSNRGISRRKNKVTKMLLVVLAICGLCALPSLCNTINNILSNIFCSSVSLREILVPLCWFGTLTYSTSNFFVYVACMPKYRRILKNICCRKNPRRWNSNRDSSSWRSMRSLRSSSRQVTLC